MGLESAGRGSGCRNDTLRLFVALQQSRAHVRSPSAVTYGPEAFRASRGVCATHKFNSISVPSEDPVG